MSGPGRLFVEDMVRELGRARSNHAPMNSAHEAYSVILEEVEEFWTEVKKRSGERDPRAMYAELVQIAAMAARAATDLALSPRGSDGPRVEGGDPADLHIGDLVVVDDEAAHVLGLGGGIARVRKLGSHTTEVVSRTRITEVLRG